MTYKLNIANLFSWAFGIFVFAIGIVNLFWGNDPFFGVALILAALAYFPIGNTIFQKITGYNFPVILKIILGGLIIWAAFGVGELFDKVHLMLNDF